MKNQIKLRVWGEYGLFTRPEMKVERVSYDVMTPSAARGVLEAVYWKPQIRWVIDKIVVLNPIRFINVRRNEVGCKASINTAKTTMKKGKGSLGIVIEEKRQQRASMILRDVAYVIVAHFELLNDSEKSGKHFEMFKRRASKGQYFHHPYLGTRECLANFELYEGKLDELAIHESLMCEKDLGYMLHDIDFKNEMTPRFFRGKLVNGVMEVPEFKSMEVVG